MTPGDVDGTVNPGWGIGALRIWKEAHSSRFSSKPGRWPVGSCVGSRSASCASRDMLWYLESKLIPDRDG